MPVLSSYGKQSIDLHSKSIDWFLYEGNTDTRWVKRDLITLIYNNRTQMKTISRQFKLTIDTIGNLNTFDKKNQISLDKPNYFHGQYFFCEEKIAWIKRRVIKCYAKMQKYRNINQKKFKPFVRTICYVHVHFVAVVIFTCTFPARLQTCTQFSQNCTMAISTEAVALKCSVRKGVLGIFTKFTAKHQCQSLVFCWLWPATLLKKRLWHRCFSGNFAKILRTTL